MDFKSIFFKNVIFMHFILLLGINMGYQAGKWRGSQVGNNNYMMAESLI